MTLEVVTLKNGSEEVASLVVVMGISLRALMDDNPIAFYELVMACRDRSHSLFGNTEGVLRDRGLYPIHDSTRNVVLSAVTGDGLGMMLGSPVEA